ncbi:hypothetical protein [Ruegeria arenilitoris]|uniref:Uncharacterized protein n=1 Tax=Ruegeria arenilitoris TaxID=1173585 RepID=A0A238K219_9RHOB|nr:hypothetical protein [Ruegeria arenilitoris]SMX36497.1 hypothetical protein RUA8715_01419 [Ruegeria arenilitoris]
MTGAKRLPSGYLARGVPGDYDGSVELPDAVHEKFCQLVAAGAQHTSAIRQAHPKGDQLKTPVQSARALYDKEHIKRRIRWLREQKARTFASDEGIFEGFIAATERTMEAIAELVELCRNEGLAREATAARAALGSLAGRTFTHRDSMAKADQQGRFEATRAKLILKEILD